MRASLLVLLATTMLSSAALAQTGPFGTPSAPLTAEEKAAIKAEGAERRAAIKAAAERAREKREAAAAAKAAEAEAAAKAAAPAVTTAPAITTETAPAVPAVDGVAPAPADAVQDSLAVGSPTSTPEVIAPEAEAPALAPAEGMVPPSEEGIPALPAETK